MTNELPFHRRLGPRLTVAAAAVTFLAVAALSVLSIRAEKRELTAMALRGADFFSETIRSSTHDLMLDGNQQLAYRIMGSLAAQPGIEKVRILNKEGRITFSTEPADRGAYVDKRAEACDACHAAGKPLTRLSMTSRARIYRRDGHRVLAMVTPIYNEPSCSTAACHAHPAGTSVLGVVDVGLSLADVDRGMAEKTRRIVLLSALTSLALTALLVVSVRSLVVAPVRRLVKATRRVAGGDLSGTVSVRSDDELGLLARSFNDMSTQLARARGELQALADGLERKVDERTSELKSAQDALIRSEKLASLGQLAASIAHEINNPLAGILTFARLMLRTLEADGLDAAAKAEWKKHLTLIRREAERCTAIVRNLLDFARARPPDTKPVDLDAVLDEALSLTGHKLELTGVTLRRERAEAVVAGDAGQLRQAVVNVLLNACDAMPRGGELAIRARRVPRGVELAFADTGSGISPADMARIFDPFFTTKELGTGLGLSVVRGIVERHGGTLTAESEVGRGTTMTIRLPLDAPDAASPQRAGGVAA